MMGEVTLRELKLDQVKERASAFGHGPRVPQQLAELHELPVEPD